MLHAPDPILQFDILQDLLVLARVLGEGGAEGRHLAPINLYILCRYRESSPSISREKKTSRQGSLAHQGVSNILYAYCTTAFVSANCPLLQ